MNWTLVITRNRDQLRQIVLALFALAGMRVGGSLFTLRRDVLAAIMLVLRPAESAARRLIVIAAHGLAPLAALRVAPSFVGQSGDLCQRTMAFQLFDPLKSFDQYDFWDAAQRAYDNAARPVEPFAAYRSEIIDATPLNATVIGLRLNALLRALDNLPRQARRLARWQAKRDARLITRRPARLSPMRPGLPPGWRERSIHEIDNVLRECHGLAIHRLDTG